MINKKWLQNLLFVIVIILSSCNNFPVRCTTFALASGTYASTNDKKVTFTGTRKTFFTSNTKKRDIFATIDTTKSSTIASVTSLNGGARDDMNDKLELKDYSSDVSSLFGNLRVPAALFAGASAGAAFAMPLTKNEGLKVGLVKRIYAILMMTSLSCQLITIIVSTLTLGLITTMSKDNNNKTRNVLELIQNKYDFEWATVRFNFLLGIIMFVLGSGLRAWVSISCPIFAKTALGIISSATFLSLSFVESISCKQMKEQQKQGSNKILPLPIRFVQLFYQQCKKQPLFLLSFVSYAITWSYIASKIPHVYHYLADGN